MLTGEFEVFKVKRFKLDLFCFLVMLVSSWTLIYSVLMECFSSTENTVWSLWSALVLGVLWEYYKYS